MAKPNAKKGKKPYLKALLFGIVSLVLYVLVFTNEQFVRETWAKGGVYAVLPLATVFVFSFIHGNFADGLMYLFGLTAKKK